MASGVPPGWLRRLDRRENVEYVLAAVACGVFYYVFSGEALVPSAIAGVLWSIAIVGGYRLHSL